MAFTAAKIRPAKKATMVIRLKNGDTTDPWDLTGLTEVSTCFEKQDGTELTVSLTGGQFVVVGSPLLGKLALTLSAAETTNLKPTQGVKTMELTLTYTGDPVATDIPMAYEV